jgi:WhiB family redox-sensing transcriptional regulator
MFFPPTASERKEEREARELKAKSICAGCSVQRDCLDYALDIREPHGIWGGLNEHERRELLGTRAI